MPFNIRRRLGFARDVSGAGLGEYALLAALIAGVSVIAVTSLGFETRGAFVQIADITQRAGSGLGGGGGSGSGNTPGGGDASPAPGTPGGNFAITLGLQSLPPANRLSPWTFDFSSLIAFQDPGAVNLVHLAWSGGDPVLPSWMSLDPSTGVASGTPDVAGQATFEVVASYLDAEGRQVFTLNVGGALINVVQISVGGLHTCAVTASGAAMCWGENGDGRLGDGTTTQRLTPVTVSGLGSGVLSISAGAGYTCAVTTAGAAMCWGSNSLGRLGDGTTTQRLTPVSVSGLGSGVASISTGSLHTCAVTTTGAARCWGDNLYGQIGDGTTTQRLTPVAVSGLGSGVLSISAGAGYTCAVTTSGAARCWGGNSFGQLGDGTSTHRHTPVTVSGLSSGVASIAAAREHTCAVTTSGAAMCWGVNSHGRLGDGTSTHRHTPVTVSGLGSGVASISAGGFHTCAVTTAGAALCWGSNGSGQIGDGTTISDRFTPMSVSGLGGGVASISAGFEHTCAVTTSGAALCWGRNGSGRLGDGTTTQRDTPVDVAF